MIIWFSGTGNSRLVALRVARCLDDRAVAMADYDALRPGGDDGRPLIFVFPVYSWGVPPVVRRFIASARLPQGQMCHMVCTCGDDAGYTDRMFRRDILSRGLRAGGAWSVEMPNTYVTMKGFDVDDKATAARKLAAMPARVDVIARQIAAGSCVTDVVRGSFARIKTGLIYPWFIRHAMSPRKFHAVRGCIGCGRCVAVCPVSNVRLDSSRRPVWGDDCAFCLACYHACPLYAVAYGKATRDKGQYMAPRSL